MGGIILQGPHHSAEKSTKTGLSDVINSLKFAISSFLSNITTVAAIRFNYSVVHSASRPIYE